MIYAIVIGLLIAFYVLANAATYFDSLVLFVLIMWGLVAFVFWLAACA